MTATATAPSKPATLRLHKLIVSNFMRVEGVSIQADGNHVRITGRNASGKTSVVNAIWAALRGTDKKSMPEPIHAGAEEAEITLDLGEYVVVRRYTAKSTTLTITAKDGSKVKRPQELLDGLLGEYALDPVAFLGIRPQDQVDAVLAICGVAAPMAQVKTITGEDFPVRDLESADAYLNRLSADTTGVFYVRRWEQGRTVLSKAKASDEAEAELKKVGGRLEGSEAEASGSELIKQMETLNQQADECRRLGQVVVTKQRAVEAAAQTCVYNVRRTENLRDEEGRLTQKIAELQSQLVAKRSEIQLAKAQEASATEDHADAAKELDAAVEELKAARDPAPAIAIVRERLANVEATNRTLAARKQAQSFADAMADQHKLSLAAHEKLEKTLEALRELRRNLLNGVDLGIDGLSIGEGELKLNGISFVQASMAERLRVSCAVAMRQRPSLRLLRVDEGERLDPQSLEMLLKLADESGWQVILTQVADIEKLAVEITDRT